MTRGSRGGRGKMIEEEGEDSISRPFLRHKVLFKGEGSFNSSMTGLGNKEIQRLI